MNRRPKRTIDPIPPRLRRLAAAAGVSASVFLQQALDKDESYEATAFWLGIAPKTLDNWRNAMGGMKRSSKEVRATDTL